MTAPAKDLNSSKPTEQSPIDARLQKLTDNVLPSSPYILTIPTNYRVGSHQIHDWRRGSPFAAHEEQLSYLSFLARTFDEDNVMQAIGDWDDGNGAIKDKNPDARSGTSSPLPGQAPKKKISFADYKNKAAGQLGAKTVPQANGQAKAESKSNLSAPPLDKISKPTEAEKQPSHKRSIDAISETKESKAFDTGPVSPPTKKARVAADAPRTGPKELEADKTNIHGLPPLLSPTLPPRIEEELGRAQSSVHGESEKLGHEKTSSAALSSSDKKGLAAITWSHTSNAVKAMSQEVATGSAQAKVEISAAKKPTGQHTKVVNTLQQTVDQKHIVLKSKSKSTNEGKAAKVNGAAAGKPLSTGPSKTGKEQPAASLGKPERKLLLVLKIAKSSRKAWSRIIKMTPRPKKQEPTKLPPPDEKQTSNDKAIEKTQVNGALENHDRRQQDQISRNTTINNKKVAVREASQSTNERNPSKLGEKRVRPDEEQDSLAPPPGKRHKAPVINQSTPKPSTPVRPAIKSPVLSHHGSAHKSHLSTPKRDLKSAAMRRVESTEGDAKTPLGATRSSTPTAPGSTERVTRHERTGSNASVSTTIHSGKEEISFWRSEHKKYVDLGRTLKHDADPFLKSKSDFSTVDDDLKQGAAIAVETVLCYMLGFSLGDEASRLGRKAPEVKSWGSLVPYISFVKSVTQKIRPLHGLIHQLEAVCRETIHLYDLERLASEPYPPLSSEEARISGDPAATEPFKEYMKFKNDLVENARLAQKAWVHGTNYLTIQDLQQAFPATWSKRTQTLIVPKGEEKLVPKAYGEGGYHLPLRGTSSGIEAVRMGWSMLEEWSAKEGVKWLGKTGL